ncbi:MAG TPA: DUF3883 domain-containing protein, partial [bacterium]|nr:DUF3883 domain-containing protein [bacterium]
PKVTFDKDIASRNPDAEFISFGHPLLEALIQWIIDKFSEEVKRGTVFKDPSGRLDGYIWFYIGEVKDGNGETAGRKIIAIYDNGEEFEEINPTILWDFSPADGGVKEATVRIDKEKIMSFVIDAVKRYKEEISEERERQARVKEKYGLKSLDFLITELDTELSALYDREAMGEKVDLPIRNKREQKKRYEDTRKLLEKEIEGERSLSISMPKFLTVIRVVPEKGEMVEDEGIEKSGMEIAMEYERIHGRTPEDVSKENLGFDIRSKGENDVRYIEVKARAGEGEVALTPNEWFKAKRFKEQYWLYIVANVMTKPALYIINNPAENLNPEEKIEVVRFIVSPDEWRGKKQEVWEK